MSRTNQRRVKRLENRASGQTGCRGVVVPVVLDGVLPPGFLVVVVVDAAGVVVVLLLRWLTVTAASVWAAVGACVVASCASVPRGGASVCRGSTAAAAVVSSLPSSSCVCSAGVAVAGDVSAASAGGVPAVRQLN